MNLQKRLIFKKFRIKKLICSTHCAMVYEGINELNEEPVALKFEKIGSKYDLLESEAYFLYMLRGFGIPKLISYGKYSLFNVLIEELLGQSLYNIWNGKKNINMKIKLNDICLTALQCIDRLEFVHSKNIIHRDIKPFNFVIGKKDPDVIYLIDFGISRKFRSSRTGKHIKFSSLKSVNGSIRYMSLNANKGCEQSRRDDLECLGYMLIFLAKNTLPWMDIEKLNISKMDKCKKVYAIKKSITPESLCEGLPEEFPKYINYCRKLEFEQEPNYNYLRKLFADVMLKNNDLVDYKFLKFLAFSWVKNKKLKNARDNDIISYDTKNYNLMKFSLFDKKKNNSHKRLYLFVKNSIDKARSQDLPKLNSTTFFMFGTNSNKKRKKDNNEKLQMNNTKKFFNNNVGNNTKNFNTFSSMTNENANNLENKNIIFEEKNNSGPAQVKKKIIFKKPKISDKCIKNRIKSRIHKSGEYKINLNFLQGFKIDNSTSINNFRRTINIGSNFHKVNTQKYKTLKERQNEKSINKEINSYYYINENNNFDLSNNRSNIQNSYDNKNHFNYFDKKIQMLKRNKMNTFNFDEKNNNVIIDDYKCGKNITNKNNNNYNDDLYSNNSMSKKSKNKLRLNGVNNLCRTAIKNINNYKYHSKIRIDKNYNINIFNN